MEKQGPPVLTDLSWLVADTRALKTIEPLCSFVETDLIVNRDHEEFQDALRASIAVIGGAARFDETREIVKETFGRWIFDPAYDRYSAMLMNALCRCAPESYPRYLARFLDVAGKHHDYFDLKFVLKEMIKRVTPEVISQHLDNLSPEAKLLLQELLLQDKV